MSEPELESFLRRAFSEHELRRFLRSLPDGAALVDELPGQGCPHAELAHQAVLVLERQGRLDAELFAALQDWRPARADEIAALHASPPTTLATPAPRSAVQIRHDEVRGGVGVQVKGDFHKDVDIEQRLVTGGTGVVLGDD